MFILSLTYVKPTEEADRLMQPHMDWVNAGYDSGLFLAGCFELAIAVDREAVRRLATGQPVGQQRHGFNLQFFSG